MPDLYDVDVETVCAHVVAYFEVQSAREWAARRPYAEVRLLPAVAGAAGPDGEGRRIDVRCAIVVPEPDVPHPDSGRRLDNHLFSLFGASHGDRAAALAAFVRAKTASGAGLFAGSLGLVEIRGGGRLPDSVACPIVPGRAAAAEFPEIGELFVTLDRYLRRNWGMADVRFVGGVPFRDPRWDESSDDEWDLLRAMSEAVARPAEERVPAGEERASDVPSTTTAPRRVAVPDFRTQLPRVYRQFVDLYKEVPSYEKLGERLVPAVDAKTVGRYVQAIREDGGIWPPEWTD